MNQLNIAHGILFRAWTESGISVNWQIVKSSPNYEIEATYNDKIMHSEVADSDDVQIFFSQIMNDLANRL